ncbi:aminopeptidase P family protein [candidate division WOR-3 bacterium]|nr:aminopeptidase P family protein [candidate division WOR-3 bacterium]
MEHRIRRLKNIIKKEGLDGFLITNLLNVRYFTGFTGSSAICLVGKRTHFLTDFRYKEQSKKEVFPQAVIHIATEGFIEELAAIEELPSLTSLGFEAHHITVSSLDAIKKKLRKVGNFKWIPTKGIVEEMRTIKDEQEIELISNAARITDKTFAEIKPLIKPGVSERDLAAEIAYRFLKYTGLPPAFSTIVASGPNSAMPHAKPTTRKLKIGDFVTFDMGSMWKGYASDFTRTIVIGKATPKHNEIYSIVEKAQSLALVGIRAGITSKAADALARDHITRMGYGEFFGHSLGHGVGLNVHEEPRLAALGNNKLKPGAVVTVEPGIYLPNWGGVRIEDLVVVTKDGVRILSRTPRDKLLEF